MISEVWESYKIQNLVKRQHLVKQGRHDALITVKFGVEEDTKSSRPVRNSTQIGEAVDLRASKIFQNLSNVRFVATQI